MKVKMNVKRHANSFISLFIPLLGIFLLPSCSKEVKFTKEQVIEMANHYKDSVEVILPKDLVSGIRCSDYGPGCKGGFTMKTHELDFVAIEFDTEEHARNEARRIKQFYSRNWVFDDVREETELEKFVQITYKAQRP